MSTFDEQLGAIGLPADEAERIRIEAYRVVATMILSYEIIYGQNFDYVLDGIQFVHGETFADGVRLALMELRRQ